MTTDPGALQLSLGDALNLNYTWSFPGSTFSNVGWVGSIARAGVEPGSASARLRRCLTQTGAALFGEREINLHLARGGLIPTGLDIGGLASGSVLAVGDAAGFADPINGEGIGPAMTSGRLAAESIATVGDGPDDAELEQCYAAKVEECFGELYRKYERVRMRRDALLADLTVKGRRR